MYLLLLLVFILSSAEEDQNLIAEVRHAGHVDDLGNGKNNDEALKAIENKLYDINDKIKEQDHSIEELKTSVKMLEKKKNSFDKPPLRIDATLHLAWGLTLNLSGVQNQVTLGQTIRDYYLKDLVGTYTGEEISDPKTKRYLDNLGTLLSTYLRSIGYEKDVYDNYLDVQKEKRDQKINNINNLADFTSLSPGSAAAKIGAFFGIGSLAEFIPKWFQTPNDSYQKLTQVITQLATQAKDNTSNANNLSQAISKVSDAADAVKSSSSLSTDIAVILAFGFIGIVALTLLFRLIRDKRTLTYIDQAYRLQQEYWESVARPAYFLCLRRLYDDISQLVNDEYKEHKEDILEDPVKANDLIDNILPRTYLYKKNRVVFRWNRVPGCDEGIFRAYLVQKFGWSWIYYYKFKKCKDNNQITIEPKESRAARRLNNTNNNVNVNIIDHGKDDTSAHSLSLEMMEGTTSVKERTIQLKIDNKEIAIFKGVQEIGDMVIYERDGIDKSSDNKRRWFGIRTILNV